MLKKSLFFLSLFTVSISPSYCLSNNVLLNQSITSSNLVIAETTHITPINTFETNEPDKALAGSFTITAQESAVHVCNQIAGHTAIFTFDYTSTGDYDENTILTINGASSEFDSAVYTFSSISLTTGPATFTLEISNIDSGTVPLGFYTFNVIGTGDGGIGYVETVPIALEIDAYLVGPTTPQFPVNGAIGQPIIGTTFSGIPGADADFFTLQVSKDPTFSFSSLLIDEQVVDAASYESHITLEYSTIYYWRVRGVNHCDIGTYSAVQSFQTEIAVSSCTNYISGASVAIPDPGTVTDLINVPDNFTVSDVNISVDITHQFVGNLTISLKSPTGTEVILVADDGCGSQTGVNVTFDDNAAPYNCVTTTFASPNGSLSNFNTESSQGNWTLKIIDDTSGLSGVLNGWSLDLCEALASSSINSVLSSHDDYNFVAGNTGSNLVSANLEAISAGSTIMEQVFTITQLPTYTLLKSGVAFTTIGETFTQDDINNNLITYNNTASADETDAFIVNITNATEGFLGNQVITINLSPEASLSVGNDFFEKTGITVYPTVSNGDFNIRSSQYLGKTKIDLFSFTGLKVYTKEFDFNYNRIQRLSVPSLATGIYILKLTADNLEGIQKLIIK